MRFELKRSAIIVPRKSRGGAILLEFQVIEFGKILRKLRLHGQGSEADKLAACGAIVVRDITSGFVNRALAANRMPLESSQATQPSLRAPPPLQTSERVVHAQS